MPPRETRLTSFGPPDTREPARSAPAPIGVGDLLRLVTRTLADEPKLNDVWVKGEISNFKPAASGHWYFDLKEEGAVVSCCMWASDNERVPFRPEHGMQLLVRGRVAVYPQQGRMQFYVGEMQPVGRGALHVAFEQLKAKLAAEGLFELGRKRALPRHPTTIGVVTSLQGAAVRDIIRTATRRSRAVRILVVASRVQGPGASEEVARGIERLNADGRADVLIVGRGGGSLEDLWSFNEERVVRAVAASRIPVISAVGHETDYTLCDLAADLRASTPTGAAERAVPDARLLRQGLDEAERRMARALGDLVPTLRQSVDDALERAANAMRRLAQKETDILAERVARLHALSPLGVLARGYAVVRRDGRVVRQRSDAPAGADVEIILKDGSIGAKVTKNDEA